MRRPSSPWHRMRSAASWCAPALVRSETLGSRISKSLLAETIAAAPRSNKRRRRSSARRPRSLSDAGPRPARCRTRTSRGSRRGVLVVPSRRTARWRAHRRIVRTLDYGRVEMERDGLSASCPPASGSSPSMKALMPTKRSPQRSASACHLAHARRAEPARYGIPPDWPRRVATARRLVPETPLSQTLRPCFAKQALCSASSPFAPHSRRDHCPHQRRPRRPHAGEDRRCRSCRSPRLRPTRDPSSR